MHAPRRSNGNTRGAARAEADPFAQVFKLGERTWTIMLVGQFAFIAISLELHSLLSVWVRALSDISGALDQVSNGLAPLFDVVGAACNFVGATFGPYLLAAIIVAAVTAVVAFGSVRVRVSTLVATSLGGLLILMARFSSGAAPVPAPDATFDVALEEPPPPPVPPAEPDKPEPTPEPAKPAAPSTAPPPPPAAAAAANVIAVQPDKPEDFTGWSIPVGTATSYAGGNTTSDGTSSTAVRQNTGPNGVPGGTGPVLPQAVQVAPPAPTVSHARTAGLTSRDWHCPFPPEADTAQIDEAVVSIEVSVKADGSPGVVRVMSDPGNGFGRMAYQCALRQHFAPALDVEGNPVPGVIRVPVRFNRS